MDNAADITISGEEPGSQFGGQVASAGDVNNDGRQEIIIGATNFQLNGKVYLYNFKVNQTITFNPLKDVVYGAVPFKLTASTTSGLPVSFTSSNSDVAVILGDTLTIFGTGHAIITAAQNGDIEYSAATEVHQPLIVNTASLSIVANRIGKEVGTTYSFSGTEFTSKGLFYSDDVNSVTISSPGAASNAGIGTYPVTIGNAIGNGLDNYDITYTDDIMTVLKKIDTVLTVGESDCYDAFLTIIVSGTSPLILERGSSSTFIAGNSIRFLSGFHAQEGSSVSAYITTTADYCNVTLPKSLANLTLSDNMETIGNNTVPALRDLKIYPNPNTGNFTLELNNFAPTSDIIIFNLQGEKVLQYQIKRNEIHTFILEGINKGIYFVGASDGKNRIMKKMVVK